MTLWGASVLALAACLAAAVLLSRRAPTRAVVLAFAAGLAIDLVVGWHDKATGAGWGIALVLAPRPWGTGARALYHLSNALVTAWPPIVAALAWWVLVPARRRAVAIPAVLWATANVALVVGPVGAARAERAVLVVEAGSVGWATVACVVGFCGPAWRGPQVTAAALVGVELVVLAAGPFRYSVFERWDLAQVCYTIGFVALAVVQTIAWRRLRPQKAGPP